MRNRKNVLIIFGGLLFLSAALSLTFYNIWEERRAASAAESAVRKMDMLRIRKTETGVLDSEPETIFADGLDPDTEMPTFTIDGHDYIGTLEIPALKLVLPVMSEWSYPKLRLSPCRFAGSAYGDDLIIMGHNYARHFGGLKNLREGDEVLFIDADGNRFSYTVAFLEQLDPDEADELETGDFALTLFTCTLGGRHRVTVRCSRDE